MSNKNGIYMASRALHGLAVGSPEARQAIHEKAIVRA